MKGRFVSPTEWKLKNRVQGTYVALRVIPPSDFFNYPRMRIGFVNEGVVLSEDEVEELIEALRGLKDKMEVSQ